MPRPYVPDRGHAIWLHFDPQTGHEQAGRRPAVVLTPSDYNRRAGLAIVCPVTSRVKGYPFEVARRASDPRCRALRSGPKPRLGIQKSRVHLRVTGRIDGRNRSKARGADRGRRLSRHVEQALSIMADLKEQLRDTLTRFRAHDAAARRLHELDNQAVEEDLSETELLRIKQEREETAQAESAKIAEIQRDMDFLERAAEKRMPATEAEILVQCLEIASLGHRPADVEPPARDRVQLDARERLQRRQRA